MLEVLGIKNAEKLVKLPEDQKPMDPVSENMAVLRGEPVKAFFYQDHDAHLAVHQSFIQDPILAQTIGQNPRAQQIQAATMAHMAEHAGFKYRAQIEQQMGIALPPQDEQLPPQVELALSTMMAQAAQQLLQQSQGQASQQQAQQQAQDPVIQMQMQELQIKQGELQIKQGELQLEQQKVQAEIQHKQQQLAADITAKADANKIKVAELQANMQLKGTQIGAQIKESQQKQNFEQEHAGIQLGTQIAKDQRDQAISALQSTKTSE
jgi:PAX-interacting protein 1